MMSEDLVRYEDDDRLKEEEKEFLRVYEDTFNVMDSARAAGLDEVNIHRRLKSSSRLARHFRTLIEHIADNPRYNKAGSLNMLTELKKRAAEKEDLNLEFKIIQEINKMIEGNIATQKKIVENRQLEVKGVIDLTKPPNEPKTIDVEYEEA